MESLSVYESLCRDYEQCLVDKVIENFAYNIDDLFLSKDLPEVLHGPRRSGHSTYFMILCVLEIVSFQKQTITILDNEENRSRGLDRNVNIIYYIDHNYRNSINNLKTIQTSLGYFGLVGIDYQPTYLEIKKILWNAATLPYSDFIKYLESYMCVITTYYWDKLYGMFPEMRFISNKDRSRSQIIIELLTLYRDYIDTKEESEYLTDRYNVLVKIVDKNNLCNQTHKILLKNMKTLEVQTKHMYLKLNRSKRLYEDYVSKNKAKIYIEISKYTKIGIMKLWWYKTQYLWNTNKKGKKEKIDEEK